MFVCSNEIYLSTKTYIYELVLMSLSRFLYMLSKVKIIF